MAKQQDIEWITIKGRHIPLHLRDGESRDEAIKRAIRENIEKKSPKFKKSGVSRAVDDKGELANPKKEYKEKHKHSNRLEDVKRNRPNNTNNSTKNNESRKSNRANNLQQKVVETAEDKKQRQIAEAKSKADKLNAEKQYEDSIKQGNKITTKDGHLVFKGKEVKKIDLDEAIDGIKKSGDGSLKDFLDSNGNLSQERLEAHRQIIEDYFGEHKPYKPGQEKKALFTGGGGASGKGSLFTKKDEWRYSSYDDPIIVDADELKNRLNAYDHAHGRFPKPKEGEPDPYENLNAFTTGWYHEESSALAKQIYQMALDNNYPVMYDGTATGKGIDKLVEQATEHGYKTEMNFLFSDWKTILGNSMVRYMKSGRLVPLDRQMDAHMKSFKAVMRLRDKFDSFTVYDNRAESKGWQKDKDGKDVFMNVYNKEPIAKGGKGKKLMVSNKRSWNFFKNIENEFDLTEDKVRDFYEIASTVAREKGYSVKDLKKSEEIPRLLKLIEERKAKKR